MVSHVLLYTNEYRYFLCYKGAKWLIVTPKGEKEWIWVQDSVESDNGTLNTVRITLNIFPVPLHLGIFKTALFGSLLIAYRISKFWEYISMSKPYSYCYAVLLLCVPISKMISSLWFICRFIETILNEVCWIIESRCR